VLDVHGLVGDLKSTGRQEDLAVVAGNESVAIECCLIGDRRVRLRPKEGHPHRWARDLAAPPAVSYQLDLDLGTAPDLPPHLLEIGQQRLRRRIVLVDGLQIAR